MKSPETLQQAIVYFADADRAFEYAVHLRWENGIVTCPRCGSEKHSFISTRRIWSCKGCKKQFTVKVGTVMEDSPIGLDKWMCAMWMLANCRNGVSSYEIHRVLGITQKSAWFMLQRIRLAMHEDFDEPLSGIVEMDETFVGGKVKNMHASKRAKHLAQPDTFKGKTIVVGMLQRGGKVRAGVVVERTRAVLHELAQAHISPDSTLMTDEHHPYKGVSLAHEVINHAEAYVQGHVHTNGIESFWSMLKRSLGGTYISVEPFHLFRYLDEQMFRYNNRKDCNDRIRFENVMGAVFGKRITYAELTGAQLAH
jgi:transposase-like protein